MKKILWGVLAAVNVVFSSYKLFETTVGDPACYDEGVSVIPLENGNWLVSCAFNCNGNPSDWKSSLMQLDENGDTVSIQKNLSFNGIMRRMPDGNLIFAGGNHAGFVYDTAKIFKTTPTGQLIWKKNLFESFCKHTITDILPTHDGFLVCGIYANSSCTAPVYDGYVAKLDMEGSLVWTYTAGGPADDQIHCVKILNDNSVAAFGWTKSKTESGDADYLLVTLTADGNLIWSKTYGDESDNYGYGMDVTNDKGFILSGYSETINAMRIDHIGNITWTMSLGAACGGRYFKARTIEGEGFVFLANQNENGKCNSVLIKTDLDGNLIWRESFNARLRDFHAAGNSFVVTGYSSYPSEIYVARFDSIPVIDSATVSINEGFLQPVNNVLVYPNPSSNIINIEFENPNHADYNIEVYDAGGKQLYTADFTLGKVAMEKAMLGSGLFTYILRGEGRTFSGKFLLQ